VVKSESEEVSKPVSSEKRSESKVKMPPANTQLGSAYLDEAAETCAEYLRHLGEVFSCWRSLGESWRRFGQQANSRLLLKKELERVILPTHCTVNETAMEEFLEKNPKSAVFR